MNPKDAYLQQKLKSTERSLKVLRQNLKHMLARPELLLETIEQLSSIQFELQSILSVLSQPRKELISVLSHEFLTPLTPILGTLQLLAAGKLTSSSIEARSLLNIASKQTDKLLRIVRELQCYQQLKSGQLQICPQYCCAVELVKQALPVIQFNHKQMGVILSVKPSFLTVWADPRYTILLLSHLLENAIKFSPTRSTVTLTARPSKEFVLFQVKDRGIGIPPERLEKIFDCFYQVDSSDSRPHNGLGLGLALCRSIVRQHGGWVWAKRTLRGGSTFNVTLPVRPQALHWWIEIQTNFPQCIYYFGPFENAVEARDLQEGYFEDLLSERAVIISVEIKQCRPENLTIERKAEVQA